MSFALRNLIVPMLLAALSLSVSATAKADNPLRSVSANHCEFYVDSLRTRFSGHYGFDKEIMTAVLVVHPDVEFGPWYRKLQGFGAWYSYDEDGEIRSAEQTVELSEPYDPLTRYQFKVPLTVRDTYYDYELGQQVRVRRKILAFNYFIDVIDQDGGQLRIWLNHSGFNFGWYESFDNAERRSIPYGYLMRVDHGVPLFDAKQACEGSVTEARHQF